MSTAALGVVTITPRALAALMHQNTSPVLLLRRHCLGDWGEVTAEDKRVNAMAARNNGRVCSRYRLPAGTLIYVITEGDAGWRATVLMTPEEY